MIVSNNPKPRPQNLGNFRLPKTDAMTKTARGVHFAFKLQSGQIVKPRVKTTVCGIEADIRGEGSYVIAIGTHPSGAKYERVGNWNLIDVPYFDPKWVPAQNGSETRYKKISNGPAYIRHLMAVNGSGAHSTTFRAAIVLKESGLTESEALAELIRWNQTNAVDANGNVYPWSLSELTHKVTDAFRRPTQSPASDSS